MSSISRRFTDSPWNCETTTIISCQEFSFCAYRVFTSQIHHHTRTTWACRYAIAFSIHNTLFRVWSLWSSIWRYPPVKQILVYPLNLIELYGVVFGRLKWRTCMLNNNLRPIDVSCTFIRLFLYSIAERLQLGREYIWPSPVGFSPGIMVTFRFPSPMHELHIPVVYGICVYNVVALTTYKPSHNQTINNRYSFIPCRRTPPISVLKTKLKKKLMRWCRGRWKIVSVEVKIIKLSGLCNAHSMFSVF